MDAGDGGSLVSGETCNQVSAKGDWVVEVALGECSQGDAEALGCSWPVWDTRGCVCCPH